MWQSLLEPFRRHTPASEHARREREHEIGVVEEVQRLIRLKVEQREAELRMMRHSREEHGH